MRKFTALLNILIVLAFVLTACSQPTPQTTPVDVTPPDQSVHSPPKATDKPGTSPTEPVLPASKYNESPMLASLVKAGSLPSIDERLPENPRVIEPFNQVGLYGGEMEFGFTGGSAAWGGMLFLAGWENLTSWKPDFSGIEPNIVESLEANADASVWTAILRKGMKWSDGIPFTADDIAFYIEDVLMNEDLSPTGFGADWCPGDMAADFQFEKVDEYTVKFTFPKSYGTFPFILAAWQGRQFAMYPKHYLQQFHFEYNDDIESLMAAEGQESWEGLFFAKAPANWGDPDVAFFRTPDYPTIGPWRVVQPLGAGTTIVIERNPYYWKVDSEGNQLPYMDRIIGTSFQDEQARLLALLNGDIDFIKDPPADSRPQYFEAVDKGILSYSESFGDGANGYVLQFNMTHPEKGDVFSDINFRIGVSYAINRADLIELFNQGLGYPSQICPLPSSPLYNEKCNDQYLEYDLTKANEYLDKVLPDKNASGMRLGSDGKPFNIVLIVINDWSWAPNNPQIGEKTIEYLRAVGLDAQMNAMPSSQSETIWKANQIEAFLSTGEGGGGLTAMLDPRNFVPMEQFGQYGNGWTLWRMKNMGTPGIKGEVEPPQWVKDARQKYNDAISQPTQEGQIAAMKEVIAEATERFYAIGAYQGGSSIQPHNARIGNMPDRWPGGWIQGVFKIMYPEQWYIQP
jgi:peptide/nickel transport system substrate-binding protein